MLFQGRSSVSVTNDARDTVSIEPAGSGLRVGGSLRSRPWRTSGKEMRLRTVGIDGPREWWLRGDLEVLPAEGALSVVNTVALEDYVAGTVGVEMSPSWEAEALRAQAVVSRTYVFHQRKARAGEAWHVRADTSSQVYGGVGAESDSVRRATRATRDQILTWRGEPILAAFHSSSGGVTASSQEVWGRPLPYLISRSVDGEDDSPYTYWRTRVTGETVGRALEAAGFSIGAVGRLEVLERSASGRVLRVAARGSDGTARVTGRQLRTALGTSVLRSTLFQVRRESEGGSGFVFAGSGHGHGVGMSQWGARAMAARGAGYQEILETFYPGTREIKEGLPTGYRIEIGGAYEESQTSFGQMLTSFAISFLVIVIVLVVQYNGWSKTLVILATLPLATMGAFFGLWFTSSSLGFMPQLGLLSLFGIVLNTGIIFIEFADILIATASAQAAGSGPISGLKRSEFRECLVSAGKQRMLPIFLTTATTIGGLLPLALSGGPLWEGMAWLMIFGLIVATILTLYVVPALYAIIVETLRVSPIPTSAD